MSERTWLSVEIPEDIPGDLIEPPKDRGWKPVPKEIPVTPFEPTDDENPFKKPEDTDKDSEGERGSVVIGGDDDDDRVDDRR